MKPMKFLCIAKLSAVFISLGAVASSAQAQMPDELSFYGVAHVSADLVNDGDQAGFNVSSNSSRIGLRLGAQINPDYEFIGQIERTVDLSDGSATLSARNTFVGVRSDWGTVRFGFYDSPLKRVMNAVAQFRERVGEGRNVVRDNTMNFDSRFRNSVHYESPELNGVTWMAHYTADSQGAATGRDYEAYSTSVRYRHGDWTALVAYENQARGGLSPDHEAVRAALLKSFESAQLNLFFQTADGMFEGRKDVYGVTGNYKLESGYVLKAQVFHRVVRDMDDRDGTMLTLGVDKPLTASLLGYVAASVASNDPEAALNVTAGGHGKTLTIEPGNDPFAISAGVIYRF